MYPLRDLMPVVALGIGRMFAPRELYRRDAYVRGITLFAVDTMAAVESLYRWPPVLRALVPLWRPEFRRIAAHLATMQGLVREHVLAAAPGGAGSAADDNNMLAWTQRHAAPAQARDVEYMAYAQLRASLVAVHTSLATLCNVVLDVAARPEYAEPLRQELVDVTASSAVAASSQAAPAAARDAASARSAGVVAAAVAGAVPQLRTKHDLARLVKLDSFLKESQRMNPLTRFTFKRIVTAPAGVTLRDATHLPCSTCFGAANSAISRDKVQWVAPDEFRGFRFFEQAHAARSDRGSSGSTGHGGGGGGTNGSSTANGGEATETAPRVRRSQPQYVSTGVDSMHFGLGKYACPGRFFAAAQLKLIMAYLLLRYDMKLPPGTGRPPNIESNVTTNPDPTKYVLMKRRAGVSV